MKAQREANEPYPVIDFTKQNKIPKILRLFLEHSVYVRVFGVLEVVKAGVASEPVAWEGCGRSLAPSGSIALPRQRLLFLP